MRCDAEGGCGEGDRWGIRAGGVQSHSVRVLKGKLRGLHLTPQVMGSPLSREFETFLKGAGNSLGNPDGAEDNCRMENLQRPEPFWSWRVGPRLWSSYALDWLGFLG